MTINEKATLGFKYDANTGPGQTERQAARRADEFLLRSRGVIEAIASASSEALCLRRALAALHIKCSVNEVAQGLREWEAKNGK